MRRTRARDPKDMVEMIASFSSYRRIDSETGETIDVREKISQGFSKMCVADPVQAELIAPADCAAAFSHCIGVMYPDSTLKIAGLKAATLEKTLTSMRDTNHLPLAARSEHAASFLTALLCTPEGRALYQRIAPLLLEAQSVRELYEHLYFPPGCIRGNAPMTRRTDDDDDLNSEASSLEEED